VTELLALGASHKTAALAVRERIALTEGGAEPLLHELTSHEAIGEAVALSTCNRTELYLMVRDPVEAESTVLSLLARRAGIRPTELLDGIYSLRNCDAARHLYRVSSGLESMIVGEAEVQGQVKRAYEAALAARTTGPMTNKLFRAALATGKRVRTETAISVGRASVASVAVDAAQEALGDLAARHVVIIGAGETAELTAQALHDHGVTTMFIANRRRERAIALAQRFGGASGSFDALPAELGRADIVIASTSSPHTLLGAEELALVVEGRRGRPLLLVDLAVPRDIEAAAGELPGVTLLDIDGLQAQVAGHISVGRGGGPRAEGIVEEEIQAFAGWLGSLEIMPTVSALRARADDVVAQVLSENEGRWEGMTERDRRRVEALARAVANRLLHEPTMHVKGLDAGHRHARLQLLRELFGLEESADEGRREQSGEVRELRPR
jgi:glutamyl-tRNA reductase